MKIDLVNLNILGHAFIAIAAEMGENLVRSAYSTIIREARDSSTALMDHEGRLVSQAQYIPIHMNSFPTLFEFLKRKYLLSEIKPGDAFLSNDPYQGGQHLNDIILITPIFHKDRLIGFSGSIGHHADIGGAAAGPYAGATDNYQEGFRIPLVKFNVQRDWKRPKGLLREFLGNNVRIPEMVLGDIDAQLAANRSGEIRLQALIDKYGLNLVLIAMEEFMNYSERLMRDAIEKVPDGEYDGEDCVDSDVFSEEPLVVRAKVIIRGSEITVDLSKSDLQARGMMNCTLAGTIAAVYGLIKNVLGRDIPPNDGCFRPIRVIVPEGTFLNPRFPAPVRARASAYYRVYDALMLAFSKILPQAVVTSGHDTVNGIAFARLGKDRFRVSIEVIGGGNGAGHLSDGADGVDGPLSNCGNIPIEAFEHDYPFIRNLRYEIIQDSGGPGKQRGGLGVRRVFEVIDDKVTFSGYSDRFKFRPWGLFGGRPGAPSSFYVVRGVEKIPLPSKANFNFKQGDRFVIEVAGGGGYGPPSEREKEEVIQDLIEGRISMTKAIEEYGLDRETAEPLVRK
ncbi:MAG: hypothetical protein A2157_04475 [Deltaproteobacteria bacterium RBG_16_47_11]|nr:MAG: hypothetical protein A2157_04475 [Deltaproteobacteria bacterium RBG_16_47_11]